MNSQQFVHTTSSQAATSNFMMPSTTTSKSSAQQLSGTVPASRQPQSPSWFNNMSMHTSLPPTKSISLSLSLLRVTSGAPPGRPQCPSRPLSRAVNCHHDPIVKFSLMMPPRPSMKSATTFCLPTQTMPHHLSHVSRTTSSKHTETIELDVDPGSDGPKRS